MCGVTVGGEIVMKAAAWHRCQQAHPKEQVLTERRMASLGSSGHCGNRSDRLHPVWSGPT